MEDNGFFELFGLNPNLLFENSLVVAQVHEPTTMARPINGFADLFSRYRLIGTDTHHIHIGIIGMVPNKKIGIGIIYRHIPIYLADNRYLSAFIGISFKVGIGIGLIFIVQNRYR